MIHWSNARNTRNTQSSVILTSSTISIQNGFKSASRSKWVFLQIFNGFPIAIDRESCAKGRRMSTDHVVTKVQPKQLFEVTKNVNLLSAPYALYKGEMISDLLWWMIGIRWFIICFGFKSSLKPVQTRQLQVAASVEGWLFARKRSPKNSNLKNYFRGKLLLIFPTIISAFCECWLAQN